MIIMDGGSISDETINHICVDYMNNVPVKKIKDEYNITNTQWCNVLKRIYRQTGYKRRMGRPVTPISSDYVTKKGTRYNITRNNVDYGNYIKIEIKNVLNILESIDWDYDVWMDMKTKNIPEDELKKTIHEFLSNDMVFTTREISEHINKKYNKYYSVEYTRTLLHRFKESESWLICKNNNKNNYRGIPLTWSVI